ncbi:glycolate oxidase subunit GlcE [Rhizobium sp. TH2]|uniref:glycolate oxidase subunit GlcE n=1 Tax=Rhizobium sp. TH2 TaxID=2775403 RepID=UPI0021571530|nr:glycolate oxidase subunit GlcE [Rhizobium sp. TH2]UVC09654.1 glycolate oxidase subunit GlcE [Rhizobium sp. TH2]
MLTPYTESDAISLVKTAARSNLTLEIRGGGTKAGLGRPVHTTEVLSTSELKGITAYNPAEMVMTAKSGTPLSELVAAAAEHRQGLAFEPADYRGIYGSEGEPTIGGTFACNLSGPRRFQAGAARDHLLGLRFVNGMGEVIQAGGRVMKNVTGLDLPKLMAGSHGTLGLMTELTFKVLPLPETSATIVLAGLDEATATQAMAEALAMSVEVSGAAHLPESCRARFLGGTLPVAGATVLRLEGLGFSVKERAAKLVAAFAKVALVSQLDHEQTTSLWQEIRDAKPFHADGRERPLWKFSTAPSMGHQILSALRLQTGVDGYLDWQGGLLWLRMEAAPEAELVRDLVKQAGGHATLVRASDDDRSAIPAFQPEAPAVAALSARIREKFDPAGIFNPGRMSLLT